MLPLNFDFFQVTGRELFSFRPELVDADDAEADSGMTYAREAEEEQVSRIKGGRGKPW